MSTRVKGFILYFLLIYSVERDCGIYHIPIFLYTIYTIFQGIFYIHFIYEMDNGEEGPKLTA